MSTAPSIAGLTGSALQTLARERIPRGHGAARAIYRDALRRGRYEPERHGLGAAACAAWRASFSFALPELVRSAEEDGPLGPTRKLVLRTADGLEHETVVLPMGRGRFTVCVSSQVGCKMGCSFCETGRMGLLRHLSAAEIVGQLSFVRHGLGVDFRNVVFMGMGEPLDNFDGVQQALRVMTDPMGMGLAQERITVCTVGKVDGIRRLAAEGFKRLNLSVSLNAATDALRSELMPVNRKTPLSQLRDVLAEYRPRRNFALGVNYCLLPGLNDRREDARAVAAFCAPLTRVMVNVIPYNPGTQPLTRAPEEAEVARFIGWLREEGLPVRRRITKGQGVMAACGQLGNVQLRTRVRGGAQRPDHAS